MADRNEMKAAGGNSRREFLYRSAAVAAIGGYLSGGARAARGEQEAAREPGKISAPVAQESAEVSAPAAEVRNQQAGMAYRRLGRTGMMISEVVSGGDPIKLDNYKHLEVALEMGLNYLDMAPAYNRGECEEAYGKLIGGSSSRRSKVFLTTKASGFSGVRERMYREIFQGLAATEQESVLKEAQALRKERRVDEPGYYISYFPGQQKGFDGPYLRLAMRAKYAERVEGSPESAAFITRSLEESLKRVGTDHFDILMCPHGASAPEDLDCPEIVEVFQKLKAQGKVRFLGVTSHNDPAGVLKAATEAGHYDVVMMAYNVINGGRLEDPIRQAAAKGVGLIAMKAAHAVATHHKALQPVPTWRVEKVNRIVAGEMHPALKAYLWALQNPNISAVVSNLWDEKHVRENLGLAGRQVELQPA